MGLGEMLLTLGETIVKRKVTMNKQEANIILNQVREGVLHPQSVIIKALTITGDIHARCVNLDNDIHSGFSHRHSPNPMPTLLQD